MLHGCRRGTALPRSRILLYSFLAQQRHQQRQGPQRGGAEQQRHSVAAEPQYSCSPPPLLFAGESGLVLCQPLGFWIYVM